MTSKRSFQRAALVALVFLVNACAGYEPQTPQVASPRSIPDGPGLVSGEEGGLGYSTDKKKQKEGGEEPVATATESPLSGASSQQAQDFADFEEYQKFKEWQKAKGDPDSEEYQEFQRWKEWRTYQDWKKQSQ